MPELRPARVWPRVADCDMDTTERLGRRPGPGEAPAGQTRAAVLPSPSWGQCWPALTTCRRCPQEPCHRRGFELLPRAPRRPGRGPASCPSPLRAAWPHRGHREWEAGGGGGGVQLAAPTAPGLRGWRRLWRRRPARTRGHKEALLGGAARAGPGSLRGKCREAGGEGWGGRRMGSLCTPPPPRAVRPRPAAWGSRLRPATGAFQKLSPRPAGLCGWGTRSPQGPQRWRVQDCGGGARF